MKAMIKKLVAAAIVATISIAAADTASAGNVTLINGTAFTNATVKVGTSTNQVGVISATSTNTYNLPTISSGYSASSYLFGGQQSDTNLWPSTGVSLAGGYPGTLFGPARSVNLLIRLPLISGTGTASVIFSGSNDGTTWVTNYFSTNVTCGTDSMVQLDAGGLQYLALRQVGSTNAAAITNAVINAGLSPGL